MCLALVLRKLQHANLLRLMSQESLVCPAQNARHENLKEEPAVSNACVSSEVYILEVKISGQLSCGSCMIERRKKGN